ncbi:hemolysin family protein [Paucibacter sp. DJ1R-11]|uniref:hemolysin family protein n=1 Tax=unclassified Roseateles TaxID=2626991 RepID=UPI0021E4E409|nr:MULTISPECIES: hemolysin family protein [unclassified Roseateles]MCV2365160.1 hemolysin family protein [Paucibacter sp. DJ1R-11]MCV2422714.1 hemolysin family protein [Paucibacter sp. DJ4R-1]MCV2441125.1 hemolysin family protein [Paucibacter sp. DJ2R-2]
MDTALVLFLILLNGLFAMSEMALTASRKARLQVMVESGEGGAQAAMDLHENPTKFLSTVQIGITSIGVLNGIVGDAAFSGPLAAWLTLTFELHAKAAEITATGLVVVILTVLTIVFGELVPKRVGQIYPETVARLVAPPMELLSLAVRPLVRLLTFFTETTLGLIGLRGRAQRGVTEEEIAASLEEGLDAGVIEEHEHQMVRNVFRLDEREIGSMMIPRAEIAWLDADDTPEQVLTVLRAHGYSRYPVCRGDLSEVLGVVSAQALLQRALSGEELALVQDLEQPVFVPETLSGMELLEHFRASDAPLVFVVDEYGEVQGVISVRDVLEAIAGEFNAPGDGDAWAVQREDGSWLLDGLIPVPELKDRLELKELPEEDRGRYNTLAGMIMLLLGRLPRTADVVEWNAWRFEVVDLDGKRVDKVLVSRLAVDGEE